MTICRWPWQSLMTICCPRFNCVYPKERATAPDTMSIYPNMLIYEKVCTSCALINNTAIWLVLQDSRNFTRVYCAGQTRPLISTRSKGLAMPDYNWSVCGRWLMCNLQLPQRWLMYAEYSLTHLRYLKTVFLILNLFVARFSDALYSGPENPLYLNAHTMLPRNYI